MGLGFGTFEFEMLQPLLGQLIGHLDGMTPDALSDDSITNQGVRGQGIYQLFYDASPVYIGKADSDRGLEERLRRHAKHVQDRKGLDTDKVSYKALHVPTFTAMDIEQHLIKHYNLPWNGNGFGNNDPGRNRDTTKHSVDNFDLNYQIDIDKPYKFLVGGRTTALKLLGFLSDMLPYTLRHSKQSHDRTILRESEVDAPANPISVREAVELVLASLPAGWQAWRLPGRVIIYPESKSYDFGELIGRS